MEPQDIFISYAHVDDVSPMGGEGIVTKLHNYLKAAVHQKKGGQASIFRDKAMASGQLWEKEIFSQVRGARIFLPILSPSWLGSEFSKREWDSFLSLCGRRRLRNRIPVLPVAFEDNDEFWAKLGEEQRRLQIVHRLKGNMGDAEFQQVADRIAAELAELLNRLDRPQVFLGVAFTPDMKSWKEIVRKELVSKRYEVVEVEFDPAADASEFSQEVADTVSGCVAAVHFLDRRPASLSGSTVSVVQLQCEAALRDPGSTRQFFWIGPELKVDSLSDKAYKDFIEGTEYSADSAHKFGLSLVEELARPQSSSAEDAGKVADEEPLVPLICLICESGDEDVATEIHNYFATVKKWPVKTPNLGVDQRSISSAYEKVFKEHENFLFYWGKGGHDWWKLNYDDLLNARLQPGGTIRPPSAMALYYAQEKQDYKDRFHWRWLELRQWDRFDPAALRDFERRIEERLNAQRRQP